MLANILPIYSEDISLELARVFRHFCYNHHYNFSINLVTKIFLLCFRATQGINLNVFFMEHGAKQDTFLLSTCARQTISK